MRSNSTEDCKYNLDISAHSLNMKRNVKFLYTLGHPYLCLKMYGEILMGWSYVGEFYNNKVVMTKNDTVT